MDAGRYPITVTVSDSTFSDSNYLAKADYLLKITRSSVIASEHKDSDGDGVVDALDKQPNSANGLSSRSQNDDVGLDKEASNDKYMSKVPVGYRLMLGMTARAAEKTGLALSKAELNQFGNQGGTASGTDLTDKTIDSIFDYVVEGIAIPDDLSSSGNNIRIVLPLESALTASTTFHKYALTSGGIWKAFVSDANNKIEWSNWTQTGGVNNIGVCPDPDGSYDNTTSQVGKTCLRITIEDGGANDQDNEINGRIVDPFAIAVPVAGGNNTGGGSTTGGGTYTPPTVDPCANVSNMTGNTPSEGNCDFLNYFVLTLDSALAVDATVDYQTRDG
ncbi:MAG: hypothetical protein KAG86_11410, partial [Gammaproteobacteria bacterium]|nr:hypothetical protein [Gammaproteobacteria bacterium]